jgi:hypothetical protein
MSVCDVFATSNGGADLHADAKIRDIFCLQRLYFGFLIAGHGKGSSAVRRPQLDGEALGLGFRAGRDGGFRDLRRGRGERGEGAGEKENEAGQRRHFGNDKRVLQ